MQLVLASANAHKIREIEALLPQKMQVVGLRDIGLLQEIPEPGATIAENSLLKAQYVFDFLKNKGEDYWILADDSGLEVQALNAAPGVHSAYYAGLPKNDVANNEKLLKELKEVSNRKARFVTVLTLIQNKKIITFEGEVSGTIAFEARGNEGFGYDPLFVPTGYRSTFAQLGKEEKNKISHRAQAVKKFIDYLK